MKIWELEKSKHEDFAAVWFEGVLQSIQLYGELLYIGGLNEIVIQVGVLSWARKISESVSLTADRRESEISNRF